MKNQIDFLKLVEIGGKKSNILSYISNALSYKLIVDHTTKTTSNTRTPDLKVHLDESSVINEYSSSSSSNSTDNAKSTSNSNTRWPIDSSGCESSEQQQKQQYHQP